MTRTTRTVSSTSTDQSVPVAPPDRSPRWRRLLGRAIALIVSTVLAVSMAGLTWAGGRLPANQSIPVTAADVPAPVDSQRSSEPAAAARPVGGCGRRGRLQLPRRPQQHSGRGVRRRDDLHHDTDEP